MDKLRLIFLILTIGYSLGWFAAYRLMKAERPVPMRYHPTPIETTTAEERARGESSFEIARGRQFGVTRPGFVGLVIIGYVALAVAFAIALIVLRLSTTLIPAPNKRGAGKGGIPPVLHAGRGWPARLKRHNSFGVEVPMRLLPRVARPSHPRWALRRNPPGILDWPTPL